MRRYGASKRRPTDRSRMVMKTVQGIPKMIVRRSSYKTPVQQEYKAFDIFIGGPAAHQGPVVDDDPSSAPYGGYGTKFPNVQSTFHCINGITQGTGFAQRIGRKITIISMEFDLYFTITPNAAIGFQTPNILVCVVCDKENNGLGTPGTPTYLNNNALCNLSPAGSGQEVNAAVVNTLYQGRNLNFRDRYTTLYSKRFSMAAGAQSQTKVLSFKKQYNPGISVVYNASGATTDCQNPTFITSNAMYFLIYADVANPGSNDFYCRGHFRLRYTDS